MIYLPRSSYDADGGADDHRDAQHTLIAVGRAGCDYSLDGGRTWQPFGEHNGDDPEAPGYYAVAASPDGSLVIAVGANGRAAVLRQEQAIE